MDKNLDRRDFLRGSVAASAGVAAGFSREEGILLTHLAKASDAPASRSSDVSGEALPTGTIGDLTIGRLICGGNLIGGWAHSRDLLYASRLFKAYNTEEKIMDTLELCEEHGVNTIVTNPVSRDVINRYRRERGGTIQWIVEGHPKRRDLTTDVTQSIDNGAAAVYIQGAIGDRMVKDKQVDLIGEVVEFVKESGVPAGVGAHALEVVVACEEAGIHPDFYVKTLHSGQYWSAKRPDQTADVISNRADNYWSVTPEDTIAFMNTVEKPWIAFKVLAAGAIRPEVGLKYAFDGGADFVCLGMFDFQVAEDVAVAKKVLANAKRQRPWRA